MYKDDKDKNEAILFKLETVKQINHIRGMYKQEKETCNYFLVTCNINRNDCCYKRLHAFPCMLGKEL